MASGVEAVHELVLFCRVKQKESAAVGQGVVFKLLLKAIYENYRIFLSEYRHPLVQYSTGHSDKVIFALSADFNHGLFVDFKVVKLRQSRAGRHLYGGA